MSACTRQIVMCGVGLELYREKAGDWLSVAAVQPGGSAAVHGLAPGARVTFLDGRDTSLLSLDQAKGMLMGAPGTEVAMEVEHSAAGTRSVRLRRGEGHQRPDSQPLPRHDFHKQRRAVVRDELAHVLSTAASKQLSPRKESDSQPTQDGNTGALMHSNRPDAALESSYLGANFNAARCVLRATERPCPCPFFWRCCKLLFAVVAEASPPPVCQGADIWGICTHAVCTPRPGVNSTLGSVGPERHFELVRWQPRAWRRTAASAHWHARA